MKGRNLLRIATALAATIAFGALTMGALALSSAPKAAHHAAAVHASSGTSTLTIEKTGEGSGTVTSAPAGIDCGSTCAHDFATGSVVVLTAKGDGGSRFDGWHGDCQGGDKSRVEAYHPRVCKITMGSDHVVEAKFERTEGGSTLTVVKAGDGTGTVTSHPSGIDCGDACSHTYIKHTVVTLTAKADEGSFFKGWHGDCEDSDRSRLKAYQNPTCTVELDESHHIVAVFDSGDGTSTLKISKSGNGDGSVTSDPAGIECGSTCSHDYPTGTEVELTAKAAKGSVFKTWGGDCEGGDRALAKAYKNPTCDVEVEHDLHVKAIFVSKSGGNGGHHHRHHKHHHKHHGHKHRHGHKHGKHQHKHHHRHHGH